jgi:hypothetical protein
VARLLCHALINTFRASLKLIGFCKSVRCSPTVSPSAAPNRKRHLRRWLAPLIQRPPQTQKATVLRGRHLCEPGAYVTTWPRSCDVRTLSAATSPTAWGVEDSSVAARGAIFGPPGRGWHREMFNGRAVYAESAAAFRARTSRLFPEPKRRS